MLAARERQSASTPQRVAKTVVEVAPNEPATRLGERPMTQNNQSSSYRTDEQLQSILHDTATWVIHGRAGFALGHAASL